MFKAFPYQNWREVLFQCSELVLSYAIKYKYSVCYKIIPLKTNSMPPNFIVSKWIFLKRILDGSSEHNSHGWVKWFYLYSMSEKY